MNKRVDTIIEEARKLSQEERDELILRLHIEQERDDIEVSPGQLDEAWRVEIAKRVARAAKGETDFRAHDDVIADLRRRIRQS